MLTEQRDTISTAASPDISEESGYYLQRARQEMEQAEAATGPQAVAAHRELAMLYSVKALLTHADADDPGP